MSVPSRHLLPLLCLATAVALWAPAQAQRQQDRGERSAESRGAQQQARGDQSARGQQRRPVQERGRGQERRQERRRDSMSDSIRYVRRTNRGQILSAERMHSNGREINRIKLVDDRGRVRVFEDDPQRRRNQRSRSNDD